MKRVAICCQNGALSCVIDDQDASDVTAWLQEAVLELARLVATDDPRLRDPQNLRNQIEVLINSALRQRIQGQVPNLQTFFSGTTHAHEPWFRALSSLWSVSQSSDAATLPRLLEALRGIFQKAFEQHVPESSKSPLLLETGNGVPVVPWELMLPRKRAGGCAPLIRAVKPQNGAAGGAGDPTPRGRLRVLVVLGQLHDPQAGQITDAQIQGLEQGIKQAFEKVRPHVEVDVFSPQSRDALKAKLEENPPDLLHVFGHGSHDTQLGAFLHFEHFKDKDRKLAPGELQAMLPQDTRLVVLTACHSAGFGQELCQGAGRDVLAFTASPQAQTVLDALPTLYHELSAYAPVALAAARTRPALGDDGWRLVHWSSREDLTSPWIDPEVVLLRAYREKLLGSADLQHRLLGEVGGQNAQPAHPVPLQMAEHKKPEEDEDREHQQGLRPEAQDPFLTWAGLAGFERHTGSPRDPREVLLQPVPRGYHLVRGEPGSGKTTTLRELVRATPEEVLPVFLRLRDLAQAKASPGDLWLKQAESLLPEARKEELKALFHRAVKEKRAHFFLDGLDEATDQAEARRQVANLVINRNTSGCPIVVTTRFGAGADNLVLHARSCRQWQMVSLPRDEALAYVTRLLGEQRGKNLISSLEKEPQMRALMGLPLFLDLATLAYREKKFALPASLPQVFQAAVTYLLTMPGDTLGREDNPFKDDENKRPAREHEEAILEDLAWRAFTRGDGKSPYTWSKKEAAKVALSVMKTREVLGANGDLARKVIEDLLHRRLLSPQGSREDPRLIFLHLHLQEHFVARRLATLAQAPENPDPRTGLAYDGIVDRLAWSVEDRWRQALRLHAAMLDKDEQIGRLFDLFLNPTDGYWLDRTRRAAACLAAIQGHDAERRAALERILERLPQAGSPLWNALLENTTALFSNLLTTEADLQNQEPVVLQALIEALKDPLVREAAAEALRGALENEAVCQALIGALEDEDRSVSGAAARALRGALEKEEVRSALIQALEDPDRSVRRAAAEALRGCAGKDGVYQALLRALKDQSVRYAATWGLGGALEKNEVRGALIGALEDPDSSVRQAAAKALGCGVEKEGVYQALIRALGDPDSSVRAPAAWVLGGALEKEETRGALLRALEDPDSLVRRAAAEALGGGVEKEEVYQALISALKDKARTVRFAAAEALRGALEKNEVRGALIRTLKDEHYDVRQAAARALRGGVEKEDVYQALIRALGDSDWLVRRTAAWALGGALEKDEVRRALLWALKDKDFDVGMAAAKALQGCAGEDGVYQALLGALKDGDPLERRAAAKALQGAKEKDEVRQALIRALGDSDWLVRETAARALRGVVEKEEVRSALIRVLKDPYSSVWEAAARALASRVADASEWNALQKAMRKQKITLSHDILLLLGTFDHPGYVLLLQRRLLQRSLTARERPDLRVSWFERLLIQARRFLSRGLLKAWRRLPVGTLRRAGWSP